MLISRSRGKNENVDSRQQTASRKQIWVAGRGLGGGAGGGGWRGDLSVCIFKINRSPRNGWMFAKQCKIPSMNSKGRECKDLGKSIALLCFPGSLRTGPGGTCFHGLAETFP